MGFQKGHTYWRNADLTDGAALELMVHLHAVLDSDADSDEFYAHMAAAYTTLVDAGSERPREEIVAAMNALQDALGKV